MAILWLSDLTRSAAGNRPLETRPPAGVVDVPARAAVEPDDVALGLKLSNAIWLDVNSRG